MFARFDKNPAMTLRVIKETKRYGRTDGQTDGRTHGRTHGQRENSIPPTNKVCGGYNQGFFQQFWEKAPGQNWEKMIDLTSKLGEINDIEHYKGSKIYLQNQVILEYIMPTLLLKHKCLSIILIWVIVYHK